MYAPEQIQEIVDDKPVDISGLQFAGFKNEKAMCDYIERNIESFVEELGYEYASHKREHYITARRFGGNAASVDFMVRATTGEVLFVEVKNPVHIFSEMIRSVSQLLAYSAIADGQYDVDKLFLVTSNTCDAVQNMIMKFELPITVVLLTHDLFATWDREWGKQWLP